jgi:UDP-glucose 4-epimerase
MSTHPATGYTMNVLITGGTGYIGAHICTELLEHKYRVAVLVKNTKAVEPTVAQIESLTGRRPWIFRGDIRNEADICKALRCFKPDAVIHAAGVKIAANRMDGESRMMETNVGGTRYLVEAMARCGVDKLVHLSSACVTGHIDSLSPYGRSKLIAEASVKEQSRRWNMSTVALRIHNVAGNHSSGFLAEDEESSAHSFFSHLAQAVVGERPYVPVFQVSRDYVHVLDVARAVRKCLPFLLTEKGMISVDIGTGHGHEPVDVLEMFEKISGRRISYRYAKRPLSMSCALVADTTFAEHFLGWRALLDLERMCRDTWFVHTTGLNRSSPVPFSRIASCRSSL